jgi:hypothetical protein
MSDAMPGSVGAAAGLFGEFSFTAEQAPAVPVTVGPYINANTPTGGPLVTQAGPGTAAGHVADLVGSPGFAPAVFGDTTADWAPNVPGGATSVGAPTPGAGDVGGSGFLTGQNPNTPTLVGPIHNVAPSWSLEVAQPQQAGQGAGYLGLPD